MAFQSIKSRLENRTRTAILLAVLVVVLLTATAPHIALTWDEPDYMVASESYIRWFGKLIQDPAEAMSPRSIRQAWSPNREHPPLVKIWMGLIWAGARYLFDDLTAHRLGNILMVGAMVAVLYLMVSEAFGHVAGLMAPLALFSMPRFFFHAHVAALDVPVTCAIVLVAFLFWKTRGRPGFGWTFCLGLAWGVALAMKINAIFVPPTLFLWVLIYRRKSENLLYRVLHMTLIGLPFSCLVWPYLYYDTVDRLFFYLEFVTFDHWETPQYYLGQVSMPPPWHYAFVMAWAVVPMTITLLYFVGIGRSIVYWREANGLGGLLILNALIPMLALTTGTGQVYDNDRMFMPSYPFLAALAGIGFSWLLTGVRRLAVRLQKVKWIVPASVALAVIIFLPQTTNTIRLYPRLLSYYSENVGGLAGATRLGLETTYWCDTYPEVLPIINALAEPGDIVWIDPWSHNVMFYYQMQGRLRPDVKITAPMRQASLWGTDGGIAVGSSYNKADFVVFEYRQSLLGWDVNHPDLEWLNKNQPVYRLDFDGVPLIALYKN